MRNFRAMTLAAPMVLVATAVLAATVVIAGCGSGSGSGGSASSGTKPDTGKKLQIAMIPKGATHEYWKSVHEGANKAAAELNVDLLWKSSVNENDRDEQIKVVEDFIAKAVDGIALAPLDNHALAGPVKEAINSKIPVVIFDSGIEGVDVSSFVATDNEKGGEIAGEALVKLLNGKGNVVMLRYEENSASTMDREKGFDAAIANAPGIKIVRENQYGGATVETALKASENLLADLKKPDGSLTIDGIYCPNESTTMGMLRELQDNGQAGKVKFVGFDSNAKLLDGLNSGQINALVLQNPRKMGYESVKTLVSVIHGEKVEPRIDTGATLVTKENIGKPEIAELIAPPKE